jgi:photosystem II stability/assembly factor-like uncharacterized protein
MNYRILIFLLFGALPLIAQEVPKDVFSSLEWRHIGPFRGGRSAAVTGVPNHPNLYYMGATGGGVWKTGDGGQTWENISDGFFGGSIGAVAVAPSDRNVIYVGGGEKTVRGNVSYGYGMWKSEDAGKTWISIGLKNSRHIPRVRIHPTDYNVVYAAVLGDLFKSSEERGVYRSKNGGKTWERILFANENAGAVDLIIDPNNPRNLYASTWSIRRTPYSLESGGDGSDLWKSTDGGDTWVKLSTNAGLPKGTLGIIGVTVSPVNSDKVWAIIEADEGGVFRSDDGGKTWKKTNSDRSLRQRAWYYSRIYADPKEENTVYVLNVSFHKSIDGGVNFKTYETPHSDHHDLWIAPENNQRMIVADDGGAQISFDGANYWTTYFNQPTAQFYRVTTDNHFPYRIYVAQQDNSTLRIHHRSDSRTIGEQDWEETAGGESAHIAVDPTDNEVVYGGSYGGYLERLNHRTKQSQMVNVWPDNPMGYGAEGMKYRFQWNFPIFFSPHNPKKIYALSNHVHASEDGGKSWTLLSPDLTKNEAEKMGPSGGPITKDNTSVEYYCTLFAGAESPYEENLIWVGSDDGLIHLSANGGQDWSNVTPPSMPSYMMINSIEIDPFQKGGVYVAGTRYKLGDYKPYIYYSGDYGKTWKLITKGIADEHFTRVVRADPSRKGLLYAGTESGMYISFDYGSNWNAFQLNLPIVPITDLTIKNKNLIAATQGRSIWIIDDLTVLHQANASLAKSPFHLFQPMESYRMAGSGRWGGNPKTEGENHKGGVMVHFIVNEELQKEDVFILTFFNESGDTIRSYQSDKKELTVKKGGNTFNWDMRYPQAKGFDGMILWAGTLTGPLAIPGKYSVQLKKGAVTQEQFFEIVPDPRSTSTSEDYATLFNFLNEITEKLTETHTVIENIRNIRKQVQEVYEKYGKPESLKFSENLVASLTSVEENLYQTKNRSGQDPLNYPIKLNNKLAHLNALFTRGNEAPTLQSWQVKNEITEKIDLEISAYHKLISEEIPRLNKAIKELDLDHITIQTKN